MTYATILTILLCISCGPVYVGPQELDKDDLKGEEEDAPDTEDIGNDGMDSAETTEDPPTSGEGE